MTATVHTPPTWPGEEVPLAKVEQALKRQYHELVADQEVGSRTRVATLVAVAEDRAAAADALDWVRGLRGRSPSRCIVLVTSGADTGGVRAFARVAHQPGTRRRQRRVWDEVVVEAAAVPPDHLAAVVLPLLLPEIPVFTWWLGSPPVGAADHPHAAAFDALMAVTDRLIVDSTRFRDPVADLGALARALPGLPATSDCAWGRLTPWREALATAFDCPPLRSGIDQVTGVTVTGAAPTPGLLLIGWLASRLGWSGATPPTGRTARYTTSSGQPLDAELDVVTRGQTLQSVYVTARGGDTGTAAHIVPVGEHLVGTITAGGRPCAPPCVGAGALTRTEALQAELNTFGRDRVYEQALAATIPWTGIPASTAGAPAGASGA